MPFNANLKIDNFNPKKDNIALVLKKFTLLKQADGIQKYNEPYIVSMAIGENGVKSNPTIDFNILPFPKVRKGDTVEMLGHGHLIYGPGNPGSFLAYSILFMESDEDIRQIGAKVKKVVTSEVANMGLKALLTAVPTYATALNILTALGGVVAEILQRNRNDELFRLNGTLLRDVKPSYDVLRTYERGNDFINANLSVIPLINSNGMGTRPDQIKV